MNTDTPTYMTPRSIARIKRGTKPNPKKDSHARRQRASYPAHPEDYRNEDFEVRDHKFLNILGQPKTKTITIFCGRRSDGALIKQRPLPTPRTNYKPNTTA